MKHRLATLAFLLALLALPARAEDPLRLGVLANRPKPQALAQWQPLAAYLETALGRRVELKVYDHAELDAVAAQHMVDVVFTNPGHFIRLQQTSGLSAPLVTLIAQEGEHELAAFGGVIFTRVDRTDISSLAALAGKHIAAVSTDALASYQMQAFELLEAGMPLPEGERMLFTGLPQDQIVDAVLAGRADAGFVRTSLLETLAHEGKLDLARVKIINRQNLPELPYASSTRLYPEWPVAVMPQVDKDLASRLAVALLSLQHNSAAGRAAGIHGFTIPDNYDGVENVLRRLRRPPFDALPEVTLADLWLRYAPWIITVGALLLLLSGTSIGVVVLLRRSRQSEQRFKTVANYTYDWEYWRGLNMEFLYLSPSCQRITGYSQFEFESDPDLVERIVHPEDRLLMEGHLKDYRDDTDHLIDFRIVRKDGEIRWIAHGCRPVYGKSGEYLGRRVSNRDITERKKVEAEANDARERLALALDATSLSMWDFDIRTGTVHLDSHWSHLIGATPGPTITTTAELMRLTEPGDVQRIVQVALNTFKGSIPIFQEEFRFRAASGDWKWIRCSGKVVERDSNGKAVRAIGTNLDITERKTAEEQIRQLAYYDTLTKLPNRRLLVDRLHQALSQARRFKRSLAIMFLDLDHFKQINDTLGHDAGDELLKEVALRLTGCIRTGDTVSRQGGDEFVIILAEIAHQADAAHVAEKIIETLNRPLRIANQELKITTSIGISLYSATGVDDAQELMKKADIAMYAAKKAGRNRYQFFEINGCASE